MHAHGGGEVISRRIGVRRRGDQHAVFHQGNFGGALGGSRANTDIGAQAVAVLLQDVYSGNGFQQLVDVIGGLDLDLLEIHYRSGARQVLRRLAAADDGDFFQILIIGLDSGAQNRSNSGGENTALHTFPSFL